MNTHFTYVSSILILALTIFALPDGEAAAADEPTLLHSPPTSLEAEEEA